MFLAENAVILRPGSRVRIDFVGADATCSITEGADAPVWLATATDDGPTGGFFSDGAPIPW